VNEGVLHAFIDGIERWQLEGLAESWLIEGGIPALGLDRIG